MQITLSRFVVVLFFSSFSFSIYAQQQRVGYPQGYFRNPLDIQLQLAANFGELRPNHYHMGFDIRTQSKENLPVYAAAEGYISHIRIEKYGYGRAIFITHPNGYTTLYGHLNNFFPALQDFLEKKQYSDKSWEQDFDLAPGQFPVSKGSFIAYSGNTGASQGPHVHFEIRDTKTGNNVNPELFGFDLPDTLAPAISSVYLYNRQYSTYLVPPQLLKKADTIKTGCNLLSLGITADDRNNVSPFRFGIFEAQLWMDDSLLSAFTLDNFSYTESRDINGSTDYSKYYTSRAGIQYLFTLPGNEISIFSDTHAKGLIILSDTLPHVVEIFIRDISNNITTRGFVLKFDPALQKTYPYPANAVPAMPGKPNVFQSANAKIAFSDKAFYDAVPFVFGELATPPNQPSVAVQAHNASVPVHDSYTISLKTRLAVNDSLRNKTIMQLSTGKDNYIRKGTWQGDWLSAQFRNLGTAKLLIDTTPPVIAPYGWKNGTAFNGTKSLVFTGSDNSGEVAGFTVLMDGAWLLFSKRSNLFTYRFDTHCQPGPHELVVTATDIAGNTTVKTYNFIKK